MIEISTLDAFNNFLFILALVGLVIFVALYFVDAGYGKMRTEKWGPAINNKVGWCLMEMPVFVVMLYLWATSQVKFEVPYLLFFLIFQFHYFQRSFVFPFLFLLHILVLVWLSCVRTKHVHGYQRLISR